MREIALTNGGVARVDDEDYRWLSTWRWQRHRNGYAYRFEKGRGTVLMHREIVQAPDELHVDHIDGDPANNGRNNLRACTRNQNLANQKKMKARAGRAVSSRYKGVYWDRRRLRWITRVGGRGAMRHVGSFRDEDAAARAYDVAARDVYGEFARLNFPEEAA